MKKSLVVLLLIAGLMAGGQSAFAVATTVDFDAALTTLAAIPMFGPSWSVAEADADDNGMLESWELKLLSTVLADAGHAQHAAAYTAWATDIGILNSQVRPAMIAALTPLFGANTALVADSLNNLAAGLVVMGDAEKLAKVQDIWTLIGIPANNQTALLAAMAKLPAVFGENGNFDGDTYTNIQEYASATSQADYVARTLRNDPPPAFTLSISKNPGGVVPSGTVVTFTSTAANGTAATHVWKKNGVAIPGATGATYTATVVPADSGSYTCEATDGVSPGAVISNALTLTVLDAASLPAMGIAGLALLAGLAGALGVRKIRK